MASEFGATYLPGGLPVGETLVGVGPVADRPDANSDLTPRFWFDSSTGLLYVDDSGTWYTLIPGTLSANTYTGNVVQRITSTAQGTSGGYWAIKISGETLDRAFLYSFGVGLGGGSSSVDAVMRRTQAKEIGFYDASVLGNLIPILAGEPTSDSHVATKNYVDTNAGGTVDVVSNVATSTILGRTTAGTGDSEELTASAVRTLLDVPTTGEAILDALIDAKGDLIVGSAADTPARQAVGSNGHVLRGASTATNGVQWDPVTTIGGNVMPMVVGYYHQTQTPASTLAQTLNRLIYLPVIFGRACTLDRIGVAVQSAVASSVQRLGLYASDGTNGGLPATLIADFGTVATTSAVWCEITISQAVNAGLYWIGTVSQGGASATTLRGGQGTNQWCLVGDTATTQFNAGNSLANYAEAGITGALPATAGALTPITGSNPMIGLRASA